MSDNPDRPAVRLEWADHLSVARSRLARLDAHEGTRNPVELAATPVPYQLVKEVVQAMVAALDSTARAVGEWVLHRDVKRLPYYPKVRVAENFPATLQSQLPGVARSHPEIAEAYRRHQPFAPGQELLGVLFDLAEIRRATNLPLSVGVSSDGTDAALLIGQDGDPSQRVPVVALLQRVHALVETTVADVVETAQLEQAAVRRFAPPEDQPVGVPPVFDRP